MSGAFDKSINDGNTILFEISNEKNKHRWIYFGGDKICSFVTDDDFFKYISNMGLNLLPYGIAVGEKNIYFSTPHFEFVERKKIKDNELLKTNKCSSGPFVYQLSRCGENSFKEIRIYKSHPSYN